MAFDVSEKYVIETEQKLGVVFPKSYRDSIMEINGGMVVSPQGEEEGVWFLFSICDKSDKNRLRRTAQDIVRENEAAWNYYGMPDNLYSIGGDNSEYIVFQKTQSGKLDDAVYLYHPSYGVKLLSSDFSELTHQS